MQPNKYWAAGTALALLVAFAAGRFLTPIKVQTRNVTVDRVVEKRVEVQGETKTQIVYRDRTVITHPDGTVEHRDVEKTTDADTTTRTDADTHETDHTTVAEKTVTSDVPRWHVAADIGVSVGDVLHAQLRPVYGAHVDYRLGLFTVGAWGNSGGVGGVSLGLVF